MIAKRLPVDETRRTTGALWGAAAVVVLLGMVDFVATFAVRRPWTWRAEMSTTAAWWSFWLPLVPIVSRIVRRYHFVEGRKPEAVVAHAIAAVVLSLVHLAAVGTVNWEVARVSDPHAAWLPMFAGFLGVPFFVFDVATYGGLAAALTAAELARASHESELLAERLRAQATALQASVSQAKLDALRMQLNPHFLFNALNAVTGLVVRGRASDAQEMLGRLGGLLRETLKRERSPFLSVAAEVALLSDFLFIEQIRFGDRLTVCINVEDAALEGEIPAMLLQPLVENAVRHGIEPTLEPGTVTVEIRRIDDHLRARIDDSGHGFPFVVGRLPREGIGLANTRARLQQLFGDRALLTLANRVDGGARVEVRLPWRASVVLDRTATPTDGGQSGEC